MFFKIIWQLPCCLLLMSERKGGLIAPQTPPPPDPPRSFYPFHNIMLYSVMFSCPGTVWSWGDGDYGKLGRGGSEGSKTPKVIDTLQSLGVVRVFCGAQFSAALTRDGTIWTW